MAVSGRGAAAPRRAGRTALVLGFVVVAALPGGVEAQGVGLGEAGESYLRLLQISGLADLGSFSVRPLTPSQRLDAGSSGTHPWAPRFRSGGARDGSARFSAALGFRSFLNSGQPRVENDGALWQGKGLTTALNAQATVEWRALSVTVDPTLLFNQNSDFVLADVTRAGATPYEYPWRRMDMPQRFGPTSFWTFDPGQSEIAVRWRGTRLSTGTANMWWGPAARNALIMSNNAPGFFHTSLGTERPLDIGIGTIEGQWIWGGLGQSDWFDPTMNQDRYFTGIVGAFSPDVLEGLTLGATRVFQELIPDGGLAFGEYLLVFQGLFKSGFISPDRPDGTDDRDQLLSLFARWIFPESGFETYIEWARNDHSANLRDFILEPEHSRAYTVGFQKVTSLSGDRLIALRGEMTQLESSATFQLRPRPTYYEHFLVTQGYTHKGQVIGAGIGPGGAAQSLAVDWFSAGGMATVFVERRVRDNDAFWVWAEANGASFDRHNVTLDLGVNTLLFRRDIEVGGGFVVTREYNRYFYGRAGWNLNLSLAANWRPE